MSLRYTFLKNLSIYKKFILSLRLENLFFLKFAESQIQTLAPDEASLKAGKVLSGKNKWLSTAFSERSLWGEIKGSGSKPYRTQIDIQNIAFKCSCPSRKFPCKHGIGLMLLWANDPTAVCQDTEPSWVVEWMDKRVAKAEIPAESKEQTEEDIAKAEKSKQKRADERMMSVEAGVEELNLWISDLVRNGLLQLQAKDPSFFDKTAARMIDAKAPGLASWVKALGKINYYAENHIWQNEALVILSKMFLLTSAFQNFANLPEIWQQTIKSLIGWSQSPKELLANESAEIIKDIWVVVGQETTQEEDIIIQRSWLKGMNTQRSAIILNFGTRFAPLDISVVKGSIIEAGVVFFHSVWPQRAVIKLQNRILDQLPHSPICLKNINELFIFLAETYATYPFATDICCLVSDIRPILDQDKYVATDRDNYFIEIVPELDADKMINWLAISGGDFYDTAVVIRNNKMIPLGLFMDNKYVLI